MSHAVSPLTGPDLFAWIALRRVHGGRVTQLGGDYFDGGCPVPCFLPEVLDELITAGLVALTGPDPMAAGTHRVTITDAGYARYADLGGRERQAALRTPLDTPEP